MVRMSASTGSAPMPYTSRWSKLWFGKHEGKSLPQVIFRDLDWFLWAYENGVLTNAYKTEAEELFTKITHIKLPGEYNEPMVVEYYTDRSTGKFVGFRIVPERDEREGVRSRLIDLTIPRSICSYDKLGNKLMMAKVKALFFGSNTRMIASRCEAFFNDELHFDVR
jgi:hypothetical protein